MAYKRTNWKDHVVERPGRIPRRPIATASKTFTPAPGEVLQQGTPQSATNFNNLEEGMLHFSVAFDWMFSIMQAQAREITTLKEQVAALASTGS